MNFSGFFKDIIGSDDYSLRSMGLPKLMLRSIFMWPESNSSRARRIIYWITMMICLFVQTGLLLYLIQKFHDYNEILVVVSSLSPIFQTACKATALHKNSKRIRFVLNSMWNKFWPHDLAEGTREAFKSGYITRLGMMLFLLSSGYLFSIASVISPMFSKTREFPYKTLFPFDFHATPLYQMIYLLQIITHYLIDMSVCGFDFLFMGICAGLTNQYILLGKIFEQVGTENMLPLYNKIRKLDGNEGLSGIGQDRKFLKLCIKHHQLLTRTTAVVEQIFNIVAFLQLCSSVLAICVSGFIATKGNVSSTQIATMGSYLIGHLIQLYIYCAVGNELLHQSGSLTHNISSSNWYDLDCAHSRKDIILIMRRAQIPAKLTAFKVFPLNFATFIAVVRLSFSSYTLLATITNE